MRIAVCDDYDKFRVYMCGLLQQMKAAGDYVEAYSDGADLAEAIRMGTCYDLVFLDIKMPNMNGIKAAERLRLYAPETVLVVLTRLRKHAITFYKYNTYRYLIKPINPLRLQELLEDVRRELRRKAKPILLKTRDGYIQQPVSAIRYIAIEGRNLMAFTDEGSYEFYGQIQEITSRLKDDAFFQIHQSFSINMAFVEKAVRYNAIMVGGDILPISEKRYKDFTRALAHYAESTGTIKCY